MSRTLKPLSVKAPKFMLATKPLVILEDLNITETARKLLTTQNFEYNTKTDSDGDYKVHYFSISMNGGVAEMFSSDSSWVRNTNYNEKFIKEKYWFCDTTKLYSLMNGDFKQYVKISWDSSEKCEELLENLIIALDLKEE